MTTILCHYHTGQFSINSADGKILMRFLIYNLKIKKNNFSLQWPQSAVILPGNEVIFSLETASDYLKDDRASSYGFKCLVVGYEWPFMGMCGPTAGLKHLEAELSFLGGMCAASLMKKDLQLPSNNCKFCL